MIDSLNFPDAIWWSPYLNSLFQRLCGYLCFLFEPLHECADVYCLTSFNTLNVCFPSLICTS
jgi:hypothetical protein